MSKGFKMKSEFLCYKVKCDQSMIGQDILIPTSEEGNDEIKALPYAQRMGCTVKYTANHSLERHDLFFACIKLVADNTGKSTRQVKNECLLAIRWIDDEYDYYEDKYGNKRVNVRLKTVSFKMTIAEANEFYNVLNPWQALADMIGVSVDEMINEAKLRMKGKHYCSLCGSLASNRHHKFSQTKWAVEKYGRKLIDDDKNIEWLCMDCHSSHNKISPELNWTEKKFRAIMGLDKIDNNYNYAKDSVKEIFNATEVKDAK